MGISPFEAEASRPTRTSAKLPNEVEAVLPIGINAKVPLDSAAKLPNQHVSAAERLRRLEEAKAFLRRSLNAGPQPAAAVVIAASAAGIAEGTLYHAKKALGVVSTHQGYGMGSQWIWADPRMPVHLYGGSLPPKASQSFD